MVEHAANALGADDARLTPHPAWLALGRDQCERRTAYRALCDTALLDADVADLRLNTRPASNVPGATSASKPRSSD